MSAALCATQPPHAAKRPQRTQNVISRHTRAAARSHAACAHSALLRAIDAAAMLRYACLGEHAAPPLELLLRGARALCRCAECAMLKSSSALMDAAAFATPLRHDARRQRRKDDAAIDALREAAAA